MGFPFVSRFSIDQFFFPPPQVLDFLICYWSGADAFSVLLTFSRVPSSLATVVSLGGVFLPLDV